MLANGDDKREKQLERVLDMETFTNNYFNAQDKIRAGEISIGLPENPTDEQLADWRAANGVPEAADKYELTLGEGQALDERDQRIMEGAYAAAHAHGVSATALSAITSALLKGDDVESDADMAEDGVQKQTTTRQLKETWGGDYDINLNMAMGLVAQLPEGAREGFEGARMADGKSVFNSPEVMVLFADIARQLNPGGTVVPNSANPMQSIKDEIAKLEDRMADPGWHKDVAANNRLEQLYDAQEAYDKQK